MRIQIQNFQRIRRLDLEVTSPITLIAGMNEAGKSSFCDAIRFGLLGDSPRVDKKGDYEQLITDGARSGSVKVGDHERNIRDGKGSNPVEGLVYPYILGAARFADLPPNDRRRLLTAVMGVRATGDLVRQKLTDRGHAPERIEKILPMLRSGWEAAEKEASRLASEARGAWRAVTGETYGHKKAEDWHAEGPDVLPRDEDLEAMREDIARLEDEKEALLERRGRAQAEAEHMNRLESMRGLASKIPMLIEAKDDADSAFQAATLELDDLRQQVAKARMAEAPEPAGKPCPSCGTTLRITKDGELELCDETAKPKRGKKSAEVTTPPTDEQLRTAQAAVTRSAERLTDITRELAEAEAAAKLIEGSEAAGAGGDVAIGEIDETLGGITETLITHREDLRAMEAKLNDAVIAEQNTRKAKAHHEDAQAWAAMQADVGPAGIPAELLNEALAPINDRLRLTAMATGWDQVTIGEDMAIRVGGRLYGLCSESARWRADAAIHEALATLGGAYFLVLDRVDVLDIPNRVKLIRWLTALAKENPWHDEGVIFVLGTFKAPPAGLPKDVAVYWLEAGELTRPAAQTTKETA
jgi:hypothetical protein